MKTFGRILTALAIGSVVWVPVGYMLWWQPAEAADPEAVRDRCVAKWNACARQVFPASAAGLEWEKGFFPHPTFRGGTAEAYARFADVLVVFVEREHAFLDRHCLWDVPVVYGGHTYPEWTLRQLCEQLGRTGAFGGQNPHVRQRLRWAAALAG